MKNNERYAVKNQIRFTNTNSTTLPANVIEPGARLSIGIIFPMMIVFTAMPGIANAAGMAEFANISSWIEENLQGTLGGAISFVCLMFFVGNLVTNPSKMALIMFASPIAAIWIAPSIIRALFG